MKVLLFGATGMVGQGVLRECLAAADVTRVTAVGRTLPVSSDPKFDGLQQADLFDPDIRRLAALDAANV